MIVTTLGSDAWPRTPEGRLLCFLLAVYAFTIFGYITAALASFFVGRNKEKNDIDRLRKLEEQIEHLRTDLANHFAPRA